MDIESLRRQIDQTDEEIVGLLRKRQTLTQKIGSIKKVAGASVYDPDRESELLGKIQAHAKAQGMDTEYVERLWRLILEDSRSRQEETQREAT